MFSILDGYFPTVEFDINRSSMPGWMDNQIC